MDRIDKKILCELDQNCRIKITNLAKKLKINRNVAAYRIENLKQKGIIENHIVSVNLGKLGYKTYKIYLKLNFDVNEKKFCKYIKQKKRVIHFIKNEGIYDYSFAIAVKNINELDGFIMDLKTSFKGFIKDYSITILVYSKIFRINKWLLDKKVKIPKMEKYSGEDNLITIDSKDKLILNQLSNNAEQSYIELSKKTNLSVDIISYRINKLLPICNYRLVLNLNKMGFYHYVFMVKMRESTKKDEEKLIAFCTIHKKVMFVSKRIGVHDFEINVVIREINELNQFTKELKEVIGKIIDTYDININSRLLKLNYVPF